MTPSELEQFLEELDVSNREFADIVGVTHGAVIHWLNGRRDIPTMLVKIIKVMGKNIKVLKGVY